MTTETAIQASIREAWFLKSEDRHREATDLLIDHARADNVSVKDLVSLAETFNAFAKDYQSAGASAARTRKFCLGEAFDCLERATELEKTNPEVALKAALAAFDYDLSARSFRYVRRSLSAAPHNPDAWDLLARLHFKAGESLKVQLCRRNAALIRSGNPQAVLQDVMNPGSSTPPGPTGNN